MKATQKPKLLSLALVALLGIPLVMWGITALTVDDPLWFLPAFSADAASFDLYWDGQHTVLKPGSEGYTLLNEAIHHSFARVRAYPRTVGLSDTTLEELRAEGRLLEVRYAEPARIHSWYAFGPSRVFYIPLSGHHASRNRVFSATRGAPLELWDIQAILTAAETIASQEGAGKP